MDSKAIEKLIRDDLLNEMMKLSGSFTGPVSKDLLAETISKVLIKYMIGGYLIATDTDLEKDL